jgi:hypothetical protein
MAEKRTIELEIQDNSKTLKQQYKEAVKELQNMVAAYGEMSAEAINAAKRAAELKDQIEDTNDLMKSFKGEGTFVAMGKAMSSVASGFSAIEGGLALVGVESEKVQETMLRVQAAMALAQGLEGLEDAGRAFTLLGTKATTALKGIKTELIATGIGAFVVALGSVVAYWDEISEAVSGVSAEQEKLNKKTDANLKASEDKVNSLNKQDNILKLQGKSEKDILNLKIAALDTTIQNAKINVANQKATKIAQVEAAKRNKEILEGIIMFITIPIQTILGTIDAVSEGLAYIGAIDKSLSLRADMTNYLANLVFDPVATAKDGDEAIKAAEDKLTELIDQQAAFKIQIKNIDKEAAKGSVNIEKAAAKETLDLERENIDKSLALMAEGEAKEKAIAEEKAKREKEDLLKKAEGKIVDAQALADAQKLIDDNLQKDLQGITDKYDKIEREEQDKKLQEQIKLQDEQWYALQKLKNSQKEQELLDLQIAYDKEYELAGTNAELQKELTEKFNKDSAAINKKYADAEVAAQKVKDAEIAANKKKIHDASIQAAEDTLQVISNLTEVFAGQSVKQQKKAFQIQKAVSIASAVIDTYKAANAAFASGSAINPVFGAISAAAAITAGLLNVKKIASQKFEGGNSTGGGGGGSNAPAGAPMTANFNTIGSSGINQLAQLQQTPTQAYVVSGEVTSAQALDRNRVQNATL